MPVSDKQILGLQIAVNYVFRMRRVQPVANLDGEVQNLIDSENGSSDLLPKRVALQQFHSDKRLALVRLDFIYDADVGMIQGRSGPSLALESFQSLRIRGEKTGQELQGDMAAQFRVLGFIHFAHPAAANPTKNTITANSLQIHRSAS